MVKVAFLDRDGTLIKDSGYTFRIDDLMWVTDAIAGLSFLVSLFSSGASKTPSGARRAPLNAVIGGLRIHRILS